jgi:hypothetical protein
VGRLIKTDFTAQNNQQDRTTLCVAHNLVIVGASRISVCDKHGIGTNGSPEVSHVRSQAALHPGKSLWHSFDIVIGGPQSQSGLDGEEKTNYLTLLQPQREKLKHVAWCLFMVLRRERKR